MCRFVGGPRKMISLKPMQYCVIQNPAIKENDQVKSDADGLVRLRMGCKEYRFHQDPFPLYPGETVCGKIGPLPVVLANTALRLVSLCDHDEDDGIERKAGDQWLFEGPNVYYPREEVDNMGVVEAIMIEMNTALRLKATQDCVDRSGMSRISGEEWLVRKSGSYIPTAYEEFVETVRAQKLDEKTAVHIRSIRVHTDQFGEERACGDEWLVTNNQTDSYICHIDEELVTVVEATTLTSQQYCVVLHPVDGNGKPQWGKMQLLQGERSFFLMPGEELEDGIQSVYTLGAEQGLVLRAIDHVMDSHSALGGETKGKLRRSGETWLIRGPCEYVPPVGIEVIAHRYAIPLSESEGIYVRNTQTGEVRSVIGSTYMLTEMEEHWEKIMHPDVKTLLGSDNVPFIDRAHFAKLSCYQTNQISNKCRKRKVMYDSDSEESSSVSDEPGPFPVISLQVPNNAAVQVINYKSNESRVEFGPVLVMLDPHEQFTLLNLSGGKPKREKVVKSLYLLLGPDFLTDLVQVETSDHARMSLQLSYNWIFQTTEAKENPIEAAKLFAVYDFVGDTCKVMASRIRAAVAAIAFDAFHKNSARIIRAACLGLNEKGKVNDAYDFQANKLRITGVDIQSVSPVDKCTRALLMKSVQMAIEITTNSQEATARYEAARTEQEARGRLEHQKIGDEAEVEKSKKTLLEIQITAKTLEAMGEAKAFALGEAQSRQIVSLSAVDQTKSKVAEMKIEMESDLHNKEKEHKVQLAHLQAKNELELDKMKARAELEVLQFKRMVDAVGGLVIGKMANAGSQHEVEMLQALGLRSTLITDGTTPINLLSTAAGLIGTTTGNA